MERFLILDSEDPTNISKKKTISGILIDTMQYLQGLTFADDNKTFLPEHEDISERCIGIEEVEPHEEIIEDPEMSDPEEKLETEVLKTEIELENFAYDMDIEELHKQKPCLQPAYLVQDI